jgi:predicted DNA-binding WGR domain protein
MTAVHLRRIDPTRNMSRLYRLDVQPDLFGGVLLVKEWGRKRRRGYMSSIDRTYVGLQT